MRILSYIKQGFLAVWAGVTLVLSIVMEMSFGGQLGNKTEILIPVGAEFEVLAKTSSRKCQSYQRFEPEPERQRMAKGKLR